jgi:hypothetical protein
VIDGAILSVSADVNLDRTRRDPTVEEDASTVVSAISSFPPLVRLDFSFFSSISRCKRSVSISCSLTDDGVDGAPILLLDNVDSFIFVNGCGIVTVVDDDISVLFG